MEENTQKIIQQDSLCSISDSRKTYLKRSPLMVCPKKKMPWVRKFMLRVRVRIEK